jgi:hypothetical protein
VTVIRWGGLQEGLERGGAWEGEWEGVCGKGRDCDTVGRVTRGFGERGVWEGEWEGVHGKGKGYRRVWREGGVWEGEWREVGVGVERLILDCGEGGNVGVWGMIVIRGSDQL